MVKVIVHGALGRMGKEVTRFVNESEDMALAALVDEKNVEFVPIFCFPYNWQLIGKLT